MRTAALLGTFWIGSTILAADLDEARRHLEAERYGKALDAAERLLEASPDDPDARSIESTALLGQKRPGQAAERAEGWANRAPGDPRPLVLLARALGAKEDWVTLRRVAVRVKDAPVETRAPVFREVARQYCGGPGCEVATDVLADLAAIPGQGPEHLLDVALEIASRGERDRALAALERYLETQPPEPDANEALYGVGRSLIRATERGAVNPPVDGWAIVRHADGDVLPEIRRRVEPPLPPPSRRDRGWGSVTFECVVLRTGHVVPVRVAASNDRDFAGIAFHTLLRWRYEPARRGEVRVPSYFTIVVKWSTR